MIKQQFIDNLKQKTRNPISFDHSTYQPSKVLIDIIYEGVKLYPTLPSEIVRGCIMTIIDDVDGVPSLTWKNILDIEPILSVAIDLRGNIFRIDKLDKYASVFTENLTNYIGNLNTTVFILE